MDGSNRKSRSGGKTSGQGRKDSRPKSSTPLPFSSSSQQQQVPYNLAQHIESDRRFGQTMGQPHYSSTYSTQKHDDESSRRSWNSAAGSASDRDEDRYDDPRSNDVAFSRQRRREHASRLPGPPPPPTQRPTPEEELRAFDRTFGRQLYTTMPVMDSPDQFGYQPSASGYAPKIELDYSDALSNDRASGSSHSKGNSSRRHEKRRHN
ncbi:hypothetical protein CT0861_08137 [Colletotrichum tofieldiae]|uniref:Uncharacterized protein n=1 Tax=Colletotrichum tofieldiae TaxID=708197 RepID=A0A166T219_9PEZI|nr:hypothetical protein CT0861_08137 [Colletotrichum tofieldiae]